VLYTLPDRLTDYVWLRPYVGGGVGWHHATVRSSLTPEADSGTIDTRLARQILGGAEVIFSSAPQFALSADYRYRWPRTLFESFELGGRGFSVAGHWYVK
jgi:hypothetical protein